MNMSAIRSVRTAHARRAAFVLVATLGLAACGSSSSPHAPTASPSTRSSTVASRATPPMSAAAVAAVDATVKSTWAPYTSNLPALYVGIVDPKTGAVVRAYGSAAPGRAATTADSVRIGSISKTFTATVVLRLVAVGKLALTQTIAQAAPAVAARFPTVAQRTLRQ